MTMGIYRINGPANCVYFGSSTHIEERWKIHLQSLQRGTHHSDYMQRHFNKYGIQAFTFTIVMLVEDINELLNEEQDYLDWAFRYVDKTERYNSKRIAGSKGEIGKAAARNKENLDQFKRSQETRLKMSESAKKRTSNRAKDYTFIAPDGSVIHIHNLVNFCKENNLNDGNMYSVFKGQRKSCKGYTQYK